MSKYEYGTYHKIYFCGVSNTELNLTTCEDKIFILLILQKCVLHWHHMYLLHPGLGKMEAMIIQHIYWPGTIKSVKKEVTNYDTCQRTKLSNIRYGKLTAKEAEEISWKEICGDIIGPYIIRRKEQK